MPLNGNVKATTVDEIYVVCRSRLHQMHRDNPNTVGVTYMQLFFSG